MRVCAWACVCVCVRACMCGCVCVCVRSNLWDTAEFITQN